MAARHLQLRQTKAQRSTIQEIQLDGVRFRLRSNFSALLDQWYVSIYTLADVLVLGGIACVPGVDLLLPYKHLDGIPAGQLFCSAADREPPTFSTLDVTARVLYREVT